MATTDLIDDDFGAAQVILGVARTDQLRLLWTREATIGGGTAQIMRNLIGERLLGLPGDVRLDKDVPWNRVPRS